MGIEKRFEGITIDASSTKDIDDAIWCEKADDGNHLVTVFITEITGEIPVGSELDRRAYEQGATEYRNDTAIATMLPRPVSEGSGSLLPNAKRSTVALRLLFDAKSLELINTRISIVPFRSIGRFTFQEAGAFAMETDKKIIEKWDAEKQMLPTLGRIAAALQRRRQTLGALSLAHYAEGYEITEDLRVVRLDAARQNLGYLIVHEFSILANRVINAVAHKHKLPFLYRNLRLDFHENGNENARELKKLVASEARRILSESRDVPARFMESVFKQLRSGIKFERSFYSTESFGHVGVGMPVYGHNTSPLRRYGDFANQQQMVAFLNNRTPPYTTGALQEIADHLNDLSARRRAEKDEVLHENRSRKRISIIKKAAASPEHGERVLADMTDGEFMKTAEVWLDQLDAGQPADFGLLNEAVERRVGENAFQPKMAAIFLAHGMSDAPRRRKPSKDDPLAAVTARVFDWMAADAPRALMVWLVCEQIYPGTGWKMPEFEFYRSTVGDRAFECVASLRLPAGEKLIASGLAGQKQKAKALAAFHLWQTLKGLRDNQTGRQFEDFSPDLADAAQPAIKTEGTVFEALARQLKVGNFKSALFEFCQNLELLPPRFESVSKNARKKPYFLTTTQIDFRGERLSGEATALSKKAGEHEAARLVLERIARRIGVERFSENYPGARDELFEPSQEKKNGADAELKSLLPPVVKDNYKGAVDAFCGRCGASPSVFYHAPEPDDARQWQVEIHVRIFDEDLIFRASSSSLKIAKRNAAKELYQCLQNNIERPEWKLRFEQQNKKKKEAE